MRNIEVVKKFYNQEKAKSSTGNLFVRTNGDYSVELVNYKTVIAYIEDDTVYLNIRKYSSTTSTIQTMLIEEGSKTDYNFKFYKGGSI